MIKRKHTPIIVSITVMLTVLGILSGLNLPNALLPKIKRPEIRVFVDWPGKGAQEIEQSLIAPLERELQGLENLLSTESEVYSDGFAAITLEFHADADMQNSYIEVLSRINQVPGWPPEVARPFVQNNAAGAGSTLATAMLYSSTPKTEGELIHAYEAYVEPALSTIDGVSQLQAPTTSTDQRVDIEFDPVQLARYSLSIDQVSSTLRELSDRSGDRLTLGSRDYALHFNGQIPLSELENFAITLQGEHIIRLGELADIYTRPAADWHYASIMGKRAMYFIFRPTADVNALDSIELIKQAIVSLNEGPLAQLGMTVVLSRDDSREIKQALTLVYGNLILGIVLASAVLFYFLRNWSVVGLVFVSIPVCLSIVMLAMAIGGYSLNVISLAGMALSVGLLLDAAIVVVENIVRLRHEGLAVSEAVKQGTDEVKGAIVSSTLSSILIFVPILMMDSSESQLFADLAFTISTALVASILVALVLLPSLCRHFLAHEISAQQDESDAWVNRLSAPARKPGLAVAMIVLAIPAALVFTVISMPSIDVLPDPKQRIIRSRIVFNEPLSSQAAEASVAQVVFSRIKAQQALGEAPDFDVYGLFCSEQDCLLYFYPDEDWDYPTFKQWLDTRIVHELAGTRTFSGQGSLLRFAMPDGRLSHVDLKGGSLEELQLAGRVLLEQLQEAFPDAEIEEGSPLYNQSSRIEFTPKQDSLVRLGMSQAQLNRQLVALTDGLYLGRFYADGDTLPFYFKGKEVQHLDALMKTQIMVPDHGLVALSQLADAKITTAPSTLLRINRESSVSLELTPAQNQAVGPFMGAVKREVSQFLNDGQYSHLYVGYRGSADRLGIFLGEFGKMFFVALLVLALLMRLTLKSWKLAIAVLLSMPLAIAGGMLSLRALNLFTPQNLDVISMIGFIILMGLVINNAILLANQYNESTRAGLSQFEAVVQSIRLRRRPIYMSTGTSIFGMLPLMLSPGEGAEIYRGLAAVIIGGMSASALLSMSFMAALLSLPIFAAKTETPAPGELGIQAAIGSSNNPRGTGKLTG